MKSNFILLEKKFLALNTYQTFIRLSMCFKKKLILNEIFFLFQIIKITLGINNLTKCIDVEIINF